MRLPPGKIPKEILESIIFKNLGVRRNEVALGPLAGFDAAVINVDDKSIVVSADPITGALERIGWLAVNVNANDVATFGVEPSFFLSCIMLPEKAESEIIETISVQMDRAAKELRMAIVGGHCETTPGLANPIVVGCTMGIADKGKYVVSGGAKAEDKIILTKSIGIEGTAILASDRKQQLSKVLDSETLHKAEKFYERISVVRDAITAFKTGFVHAMHDPTEGGLAGGTHEMADAASLGVRILEEKIRIEPETAEICDFFKIDPLQLIASGSLLIAAEGNSADKVVKALERNHVEAAVIGEFVSSPDVRLITHKNGKVERLVRPVADHLWKALEKPSVT
jgi:hydrogenase expression/formation protein HypE